MAGAASSVWDTSTPTSWGQSLNQYVHNKSTRPFPDEAYAKPRHITRYEKAREEVTYNPVLQTFTDSNRESAAREREDVERVKQLNRARDKQIAKEAPFNILNHSNKRGALSRLESVNVCSTGL